MKEIKTDLGNGCYKIADFEKEIREKKIELGNGYYKIEYYIVIPPYCVISSIIRLYQTEWYKNGQLHRKNGPAIECEDGDKLWYKKGKLHRKNRPAIEQNCGTKRWFINGLPHREDGPAIEYTDGDKFWFINGRLHREDGPAVDGYNGNKEWWINGELIKYNKLAEENPSRNMKNYLYKQKEDTIIEVKGE
jgi:hypothetical protein